MSCIVEHDQEFTTRIRILNVFILIEQCKFITNIRFSVRIRTTTTNEFVAESYLINKTFVNLETKKHNPPNFTHRNLDYFCPFLSTFFRA